MPDRMSSEVLNGHTRYFFYEVAMPDSTTIKIKTNLSPEDLIKYFPSEKERASYLLLLARISPLWQNREKTR